VGAGGIGLAGDLQGRHRCAAAVFLRVLLSVAHDGHLQSLGQRIDDRKPDPVQPTGDLVAATTELSTGVQLRHHDLEGRLALVLHDVDGDAAAVVGDGGRAVLVERYFDPGAEARQRLINGVVDDLVDEVVETPVIGGPDVHPGTAFDWLQTLQNLDGFGVIGRRRLFLRIQQIAYSNYTQFGLRNRSLWRPNMAGFSAPVRRRLRASRQESSAATAGPTAGRREPRRGGLLAPDAARS